MFIKTLTATGIALAFGALVAAAPPVPRPAAELAITEPSGKQSLLSEYRGNVVIVQFLYTTCSHCAATARTFTKLQSELGSRGLRVVGLAFNEEAQRGPQAVRDFITRNQVGFPVGVAARDKALEYLGLSVMSQWGVPQVLIIDRAGVIRAQSEPRGSAELQDEALLRPLLEKLLNERSTISQVRK